jgi:hypothetical protein
MEIEPDETFMPDDTSSSPDASHDGTFSTPNPGQRKTGPISPTGSGDGLHGKAPRDLRDKTFVVDETHK